MDGPALRFGIIGCGDYGRRHIERLQRLSLVHVAAISDPSPAARASARDALAQAPEADTDDFRALLECPLDAVVIASPDIYHTEQVLAALRAGLHVLCEKPLTPYADDLRAILAARDAADRVVALTYQRRYDGAHRAMRREIRSGRWGQVTAVTVYNSEDWITPNLGTWRHDPSICPGGFLYDASGHQLDMAFWATGLQPISVRAHVHHAGTPVPIRAWGSASLTGGVPMTFHFVGDAHAWREQVNIHCEGRDFLVESFRPRWIVERAACEIEPSESGSGADIEFVEMLRNGAANAAPPDDLWPVLKFTEAALRSAASGRTTDTIPTP
jgi:predicted dehydrogenase